MKKDTQSEAFENYLKSCKKLGLLKDEVKVASKPIPKDIDGQILDFCERLRAANFNKQAQEIENHYLELKGLSTKLQVMITKNFGEEKHPTSTRIDRLPEVATVFSPATKQKETTSKVLGSPLTISKKKMQELAADVLSVSDNTNDVGEPQLKSEAFIGLVPPALGLGAGALKLYYAMKPQTISNLISEIKSLYSDIPGLSAGAKSKHSSILSQISPTIVGLMNTIAKDKNFDKAETEISILREYLDSFKLINTDLNVALATNQSNPDDIDQDEAIAIGQCASYLNKIKQQVDNKILIAQSLIKELQVNGISDNEDTPAIKNKEIVDENIPGSNKQTIDSIMDQIQYEDSRANKRMNAIYDVIKPGQTEYEQWYQKTLVTLSQIESKIGAFGITEKDGSYKINYKSDPAAMQAVVAELQAFNKNIKA